jgi:hypothetical protein
MTFNYTRPYPGGRSPLMTHNVVSTTHSLATDRYFNHLCFETDTGGQPLRQLFRSDRCAVRIGGG